MTKFQYKICYSKILKLNDLYNIYKNFNTKFVIAKLQEIDAALQSIKKFQYKICYSKIRRGRKGL